MEGSELIITIDLPRSIPKPQQPRPCPIEAFGPRCSDCGILLQPRRVKYRETVYFYPNRSTRCQSCASRASNLQRPKKQRPTSICPCCGESFTVNRAGHTYCSAECAGAMKVIWTSCLICGRDFDAPNRHQMYCSVRCQGRALQRPPKSYLHLWFVKAIRRCGGCGSIYLASRQYRGSCPDCASAPKPPQRVECRWCGATFEHPTGNVAFCSLDCQRSWQRKRKPRSPNAKCRRKGSGNWRKRLPYLIERDGGRCQLCGKKVADHRVPHPKAPTVDHIVPRSHGGGDEDENLQLAHFECNWRKAAGGCDQLRLIG